MPGIQDRSMGWKTCRQYIPIREFEGIDNDGTDDISLSQGTPARIAATGTLEVCAMPMDAADEVHHIIPIPWNMNRDKKVLGRVFFIHASTDAGDTPIFKLGVKFYGKQDETVEAKGGADADVSITSPDTVATDNSLEVTDWTDLEWDKYMTAEDVMAAITLELDNLGTSTADECEVLGIELMWEIDACDGVRRRKTASEVHRQPI
jgi:hypothetical protein